jgi:predicted nucleic-acid-binding protein
VLAVDTNVIVQLVTNDDPKQAKRAVALFAGSEIFLPKTVLLETEWVLRYSYGLQRDAIARSLRGVLGLPGVIAEDAVTVRRALDSFGRGLDFADALHVASSGTAIGFATFDSQLIRRAKSSGLANVVGVV